MNPITEDDLMRFIDGELDDAARDAEIQTAIEQDAELAERYERLLDDVEPSPEVHEWIAGHFAALQQSHWTPLPRPVASAADVAHEVHLQCAPGVYATVKLCVSTTEVRVQLLSVPPGWRPASIVLFHPAMPPWEPLELGEGHAGDVGVAGRRQAESRDSIEPVQLAAAHRAPFAWWQSISATNAQGAEARLADSVAGLAVFVKAPEPSVPLRALQYRLSWCPPGQDEPQEKSGLVQLPLCRDGFCVGQAPLGVRPAELQRAAWWGLTVEPCGPQDVERLEAQQFEQVVGDDLETLVLCPTGESDPPGDELRACFHSPRQRQLWDAPTACCLLRFEPR